MEKKYSPGFTDGNKLELSSFNLVIKKIYHKIEFNEELTACI